MKKNIGSVLAALLFLGFSSSAFAAHHCKYSFAKDSVKFNFTGYKFTNKTGVKGTFKKFTFESNPSHVLGDLVDSVTFNIKANSLDTGVAERNKTIFTNVFKILSGGSVITGRFSGFDEKKRRVNIVIRMNDRQQKIPLKLTKKGKVWIAEGSMDMLNFSMKKSHELISAACKQLHTGEDGVSKTWSEVGLRVEGEIIHKCG